MRPCESELNVVVCTHPGPQLQLPEGGAGRRPLSSLSWCLMYTVCCVHESVGENVENVNIIGYLFGIRWITTCGECLFTERTFQPN